jgi:hypothetical protein
MVKGLYEKVKLWGIYWLARRLPACQDTARMLSDAMDRPLSLRQRLDIKLHLMICTWCARYEKQLRFIRDVLHRQAEGLEHANPPLAASLSSDARERIKRALSQQD